MRSPAFVFAIAPAGVDSERQARAVTTWTDQRGRFRLLLEPGRYETGSMTPASVTVRSGHFDRRDFTYPYEH